MKTFDLDMQPAVVNKNKACPKTAQDVLNGKVLI